ncbi:hypothetical protein ACLM45_12760 [Synechococcus sp. A10-1-5-9]|uniref:hypothetical protein n=1 Tax=Synechococcus sp. A10-1-5-9 TaxID=3392295 RepID=UPI0039E8ABA0
MADLLKHPALLAWIHACVVTDHMDVVFAPEDDRWAHVHNAADCLRHTFSMKIPVAVRAPCL